MNKLTLSVDPAVIARAKKLAKSRGTSVSAMFERVIRAMPDPSTKSRQTTKGTSIPLGPIARQASGLISLPAGKTDRQLVEEALMDRYGFKS